VSDRQAERLAAVCLVVGSVFGVAGTFVPSASVRGVAWGIDGIALIVGTALLAVHFVRLGQTVVAAGFLVFLAGETLVVAGSAMDLVASAPLLGAGAGLWAASFALISSATVYPMVVRGLGFVATILLGASGLQILAARPLDALSRPLPFFAYPFLAATLVGYAWYHYSGRRG
jgi:hypothetical protein